MHIFLNMESMDIPEGDIPKLERIVSLEEGVFGKLIAAVRSTEPTLKLDNYVSNLISKVDGLTEKDALPILTVIIALHRAKDASGLDFEKIVKLALNFLSESYSERFPAPQMDLLKNRLTELLHAGNSAMIAARSLNVMTSHDCVFLDARIFSDIRPVFGDSVESAEAATVIHTLKIEFKRGQRVEDFYVSVDNDDLKKLKNVIERAEKKTKALVSIIEKSQVRFLDPTGFITC